MVLIFLLAFKLAETQVLMGISKCAEESVTVVWFHQFVAASLEDMNFELLRSSWYYYFHWDRFAEQFVFGRSGSRSSTWLGGREEQRLLQYHPRSELESKKIATAERRDARRKPPEWPRETDTETTVCSRRRRHIQRRACRAAAYCAEMRPWSTEASTVECYEASTEVAAC